MVRRHVRDTLDFPEPGVRARIGLARDDAGFLEHVINLQSSRPQIARDVTDVALSRQRHDYCGLSCRHGRYGACTSPDPTSLAGRARGLALARSLARRALPRSAALDRAQSASHPATCGVAMLVPLIVLCCVGRGHDENVFTPGPAMSILPPLEKMATRRALSSAATDMIVGEFAGAPAGWISPGRLLALPAAAMIKQPLATAAAPAAV